MFRFVVSPDGLRAAAAKVDAIVDGLAATARLEAGVDLGHARLASSVASFAAAFTRAWEERRASTGAIASGLRRTATIYTVADGDGAAVFRTGSGVALS